MSLWLVIVLLPFLLLLCVYDADIDGWYRQIHRLTRRRGNVDDALHLRTW